MYLRLSKDDEDRGSLNKSESNSIGNQRELIKSFLREQPDIELFRRVFINDKPVFIRFAFSVSINGKSSNTFAIFILYLKLALYLCGNIPAVGIIYEILYRQVRAAAAGEAQQ